MTHFIPFSSNPFEEPLFRRLPILCKENFTLYDQFVKNLIAALYYQDFEVTSSYRFSGQKKNQEQLYERFLQGDLRILDFDGLPISPLIRFMNLEIKAFENENMPEAKEYINFLTTHKKLFKCIDRAVDYNFEENYIKYAPYIYDKMGNLHYLEKFEIDKRFESIKVKLVKQLKRQLIAHLHIQGLDHSDLKEELDALKFHLNNELIDPKKTHTIKAHTIQWFGQLLRHIGFVIGWHDYKSFFDEAKELCCQAIGYNTPTPTVADIDYPRHIFTKPAAYLLFHELASQFTKKSPISFLYRQMAEKDNLIHARDTEFRDWFQSCGYPAELYSTTETYDRAQTEERKIFLELLYKKYNLP